MSKFKVLIVEHGYSSIQPERDIVESAGGELIDGGSMPLEKALAIAAGVEAVMVRRVKVGEALLRSFAKCKVLLRYGVGVDNIDLSAASRRGIIVSHVPIYCQDEVSTHALALLLSCIREIGSTDDKMRRGGWDLHRTEPVYRMAGKTLGIVGLGTLGQAFARKLQGWNLRVLAADPYIEPAVARALGVELVSLERLLRECDYISLHVPLLPETTHLINARSLAIMKRGAILVNTARGPIVHGPSLLAALDKGQLTCAALDVFEEEPLPDDSPLRRHPRLMVTDHMAWYSEDSQLELQQRAAHEVVRVCTGVLPTAIANPEVLDLLGRASEWTPNHVTLWQRKRAALLAAKSSPGTIPA
jgi:D-3-phosphoglycerate dehydrogenase / 2-oxoglutarate reductase